MTDTITATDRLAGLLRLQEQQRADFVAQLLDAERQHAASILGDLQPDAGARLADALEAIEAQIRRDVKADRLLAKVVTQLPEWADRALPPLDPDDSTAGRRSVVLFVPRATADGHRERLALAVVDVTDSVFGKGAGQRRDQIVADDRAAERRRDAEIQRDRQREAARR